MRSSDFKGWSFSEQANTLPSLVVIGLLQMELEAISIDHVFSIELCDFMGGRPSQ